MNNKSRIIILGAAGLVGQNLIIQLKTSGYNNLVAIDKHKTNLGILSALHNDIVCIEADLASKEDTTKYERYFDGASIVLMLQAQISALAIEPFIRNNVVSTEHVLLLIKKYKIPYLIHISSSVINSKASDFYSNTKKQQEKLVIDSGVKYCILRPTLMFGWFDRKHLGWLSRFMEKMPIFPIPGHGRYMRQPLYVKDFCSVILAAMTKQPENAIYDITGKEKIDYIDIIRAIKKAKRLKTPIIKIPYKLFYFRMHIYALFNKNPPFTTQQLEALATDDRFDLITWWDIFDVVPTPFLSAIDQTFNDADYSKYVLEF
jgi:nucleoside-diphosphate-sugar epimerase